MNLKEAFTVNEIWWWIEDNDNLSEVEENIDLLTLKLKEESRKFNNNILGIVHDLYMLNIVKYLYSYNFDIDLNSICSCFDSGFISFKLKQENSDNIFIVDKPLTPNTQFKLFYGKSKNEGILVPQHISNMITYNLISGLYIKYMSLL